MPDALDLARLADDGNPLADARGAAPARPDCPLCDGAGTVYRHADGCDVRVCCADGMTLYTCPGTHVRCPLCLTASLAPAGSGVAV